MNLHEHLPVLRGGPALPEARAALVLLHGRGSSAEDIYALGEEVSQDLQGVALLAPRAAGGEWYPQRFLAPLAQNEPSLSSALAVVSSLVDEALRSGVSYERILVAGFSQGACLALEFAARNPRRYGGIAGLSGALIGPPGMTRVPSGSLAGTRVYLGCDSRDPHIPLPSVEETAAFLQSIGARVTKTIFAGLGHTVGGEEIGALEDLVRSAAA